MSTWPKIRITALLILGAGALAGCLGTEVKNHSTTATSTAATTTTDVESFSINLAYRAGTSRVVTLQGVRDIASANLSIPCGSNGASCSCLFYTSTLDTNPVGSSAVGISAGINSYSCTIAGAVDPSTYKYVRIRNTAGTSTTGFINIKTTLTINDVIGTLDKTKVRGVYRYTCTRTFLEGEGVSAGGVTCVDSQKLGLITAPYDFYLYSGQTATNNQPASILGNKFPGSVFEICLRQLAKTSCTASPNLRYGLYGESVSPFTVGITMTSKPEASTQGEVLDVQMGFAAQPDSAGNCPVGLIKVMPWQAQPQSIIAGSLDGVNPPTNFLNNGTLNNTVVESDQPANFIVTRQSNAVTCKGSSTDPNDPSGNCRAAQFNGGGQVQTITYNRLSPVVCVIPPDLLSGVIP